MKASKWIIAGVLAIALLFLLARLFGPAGEGAGGPAAGEPAPSKGPSSRVGSVAGSEERAAKGGAPRPGNSIEETTDDTDLGPPVYGNPEQALANVNGVAITIKDLLPIPADSLKSEYVMTTARYNFLLDRAVARELTFQVAKAQGVELNARQRKALADAAERRRTAYDGQKVFDNLQDAPENAEFQQRDFEALMLQSILAEKAGVPSPNVGPEQVQAYYKTNRDQFSVLPSDPDQQEIAWSKIESEIRAKLAPVIRREHNEHFFEFINELKQDANISYSEQ